MNFTFDAQNMPKNFDNKIFAAFVELVKDVVV